MHGRFVSSIAIVLVVCGVLVYWATQEVQRPVVRILAATDVPENGLPVYAQFVTTQRLVVDEMLFSRLDIPMYVPADHNHQFLVRLIQHDQTLQEWQIPRTQGSHAASLYPDSPVVLSGELDIQFDGSSIPYELQEQAPRVFVEKADSGYPQGNYRIVDNEKAGDIALTMLEALPRYRTYIEQFNDKPLTTAAYALSIGALVFLFAYAPFVPSPKK